MIFLLSTGFRPGRRGATTPSSAHGPASSTSVNLNDSDNARKARAVLDQTIQTLGGDWYLTYQNKKETGRYYPLYHGRTKSTGIPYNYYVEYPDKDRFEVIHTKDILPDRRDRVGNVKVKNKFDLVLIHNGDKGYEIYLQGNRSAGAGGSAKLSSPPPALAGMDFSQVDPRSERSLVLRRASRSSMAKHAKASRCSTPERFGEHLTSTRIRHYPVKISYSWRDPKDKQKNVEDEVYDNYKLVQGIWTAHSITRYYNGETSQQRFVTTASYNQKLPDSMFEATVTYDPKAPPKKH